MNVLVTGATGFIGSHLTELLLKEGHTVRVLTRASSNTKWIDGLDVEKVVGSFSDIESLKPAVEKIDVIYHLAGVVASSTRKGFFDGNVEATRTLMDASLRFNPGLQRFVFGSSLASTGPASSADRPKVESDPYEPITTYGESKAEAERLVFGYADRMPITIFNPPPVYGPRDIGVFTFFQVVARGIAPLIGFDHKLVSLVHVGDLVRGIYLSSISERAIGERYFLGSDKFYAWEEVGEVTTTYLGRRKPRFIRIPHAVIYTVAGISGFIGKFQKKAPILDLEKGRDITQRFWIASNDKAREHFGYRQEISLEEGVADTVQWYLDQGWI